MWELVTSARLAILGSAGSAPWANRNLPGVFVDGVLLDCGEGVARALVELGLLDLVDYVFLTHLHGDHVSGLPMLLWLYALRGRERKLTLVGPRGEVDRIWTLLEALRSPIDRVRRFLEVEEIDEGEEVGPVEAVHADHGVKALAYRVSTENGDLCYSGDTAPSESVRDLARGCRILVHEATYPPGREEEAACVGHSTPLQAAEVAEEAGVEVLVLIHLPYFYFNCEGFLSDFKSAAMSAFRGRVVVLEKDPQVLYT